MSTQNHLLFLLRQRDAADRKVQRELIKDNRPKKQRMKTQAARKQWFHWDSMLHKAILELPIPRGETVDETVDQG